MVPHDAVGAMAVDADGPRGGEGGSAGTVWIVLAKRAPTTPIWCRGGPLPGAADDDTLQTRVIHGNRDPHSTII